MSILLIYAHPQAFAHTRHIICVSATNRHKKHQTFVPSVCHVHVCTSNRSGILIPRCLCGFTAAFSIIPRQSTTDFLRRQSMFSFRRLCFGMCVLATVVLATFDLTHCVLANVAFTFSVLPALLTMNETYTLPSILLRLASYDCQLRYRQY